MKDPQWTRPESLAELAAESKTYQEFGYNLKDFLHEYPAARKHGKPIEPMLKQPPLRLASRFKEGRICDGFLGGLADYLSRLNGFNTPEWALAADLMLEEPWFSSNIDSVRRLLFRDTPSAFKDKNIFIFENDLTVA